VRPVIPRKVVEEALELLGKSRSNYEYFFAHLTSPDWLDPLCERGFFREPEKPIREGNGVRYPVWPESAYLARVAKKAPEKVLEIALQIPETDNIQVHDDLARAALSMPPAMAATWVSREVEWLEKQQRVFWLLPDELGKLITHLAEGSELKAAFALARLLLKPRAPEKKPEDEKGIYWPGNPILLVEPYEYSELLRLRVPDLAKVDPLETLNMLFDHLEAAIRIYLRQDEDTLHPPADYSYLWRPAIEEHEQNAHGDPYDIKSLLTVTVRDLAEQFVEQGSLTLPQLLKLLEARGWDVFRRIALHLLRRFAHLKEAKPLIVERLLSAEHLQDIGEHHEYGLLLRDQFHELGDTDQVKVLEIIDTGFDAEAYTRGFESVHGRVPTEEDVAEARDYWLRRRWSLIADDLPPMWKERYEAIVAARGATEHPEFLSRITFGWAGPTSAKSQEELSSMTIADLANYLGEWQPSGGFGAPSREGLSGDIVTQVRARPGEFAREADHFIGLDATYVRAVFDGLAQVAKEKLAFEWAAVLRLARWVVEQPREIPGRSEHHLDDEADPNWGWARKAVARLLGIGFESQTTPFPAELRALAWEILRPITDDPEPTPDYEARYGGSNMDPLTLSINTTRGEAMHAVPQYCLWIRRLLETASDAEERLTRGFDEMPEAREVLDAHLDPARDPSMAIRAVYGQWLPWLALLDEVWTRNNLGKLFPEEPDLLALREATWDTYVVVNQAYTNLLGLLSDQYAWAMDRFGSESRIKSHLGDPDTAMARHLMVYYWQGSLDLDDADGILAKFYTRAPDSVRGDAIDFIGRSLAQTPNTPQKVADRLRHLWENRLAAASEMDREEMAAFGWWFISGAFDDEWLTTNLREALRKAEKVEPAHKVAERLAQIASSYPLIAVECLGYMVRGDAEGWGIRMWTDDAKIILATALASADPSARKAARNLRNELGARGHWQFRELPSIENTTS
jgi:hypothetical protein